MSWIVVGLTVGSALYKGVQAEGVSIGGKQLIKGTRQDVATGKGAAYDLQQEQLGLLGEQHLKQDLSAHLINLIALAEDHMLHLYQ